MRWLVATIGAVAVVMIAGTQLSSAGALGWDDDPLRFWVAAGSLGLVLVCVTSALGLVTWLQMPLPPSDIEWLERVAAAAHPNRRERELLVSVTKDSVYHRGTDGLKELLAHVKEASDAYYLAKGSALDADLASLGAETRLTRKPAGPAPAAPARSAVPLLGERYRTYRAGLRETARLASLLRFGHRSRIVAWAVLGLALASAVALVGFAWAVNPGTEAADPGDAIPADPVVATLVLASTDEIWATRLGSECAQAARDDAGIAVVALSADAEGVEVVVLPEGVCDRPARAVVPIDEGTVTAAPALARGSG